jgi:hypothetical protein
MSNWGRFFNISTHNKKLKFQVLRLDNRFLDDYFSAMKGMHERKSCL